MIPLELITHLVPVGWALLLDTLLQLIVNKHAIMMSRTMTINDVQRPSITYQPRLSLSPSDIGALNPTYNDDGDHGTTSTSGFIPHPTLSPSSFDFVTNDIDPSSGIDDDITIFFVDRESDVPESYSYTIPNAIREDVTAADLRLVNETPGGDNDNKRKHIQQPTSPRASDLVLFASQRMSFCPLAAMVMYYGWTVIAYFVLVIPTIVCKWALERSCFLDPRATLPFEEKLLWLFRRVLRYVTMVRWIFLLHAPARGNGTRLPYDRHPPLQWVDSYGTIGRQRTPVVLVSHVEKEETLIVFDPDDQGTGSATPQSTDLDDGRRSSWLPFSKRTQLSSSSDARVEMEQETSDLAVPTNHAIEVCSRGDPVNCLPSRFHCALTSGHEQLDRGTSDNSSKAPGMCHVPADGASKLPVLVIDRMTRNSEAAEMDGCPDRTKASENSSKPIALILADESLRKEQSEVKSRSDLADDVLPLCGAKQGNPVDSGNDLAIGHLTPKDVDSADELDAIAGDVQNDGLAHEAHGCNGEPELPKFDGPEAVPTMSGSQAVAGVVKSVRFAIPDEPEVPYPDEMVEILLRDDLKPASDVSCGRGSEKQSKQNTYEECSSANAETTEVLIPMLPSGDDTLGPVVPPLSPHISADEPRDEDTCDHERVLSVDPSPSSTTEEKITGTQGLGLNFPADEIVLSINSASTCLLSVEKPLVKLPTVESAPPDEDVLAAGATPPSPVPIKDAVTRSPAQVERLVDESAVVINMPGCIINSAYARESQRLVRSVGASDASATFCEGAHINSPEIPQGRTALLTCSESIGGMDEENNSLCVQANTIGGDGDLDAANLPTLEPSEETAVSSPANEEPLAQASVMTSESPIRSLAVHEESTSSQVATYSPENDTKVVHLSTTIRIPSPGPQTLSGIATSFGNSVEVQDMAATCTISPILDGKVSPEYDTCPIANPPRAEAGPESVEQVIALPIAQNVQVNGDEQADRSRVDVDADIVQQQIAQKAPVGHVRSEVEQPNMRAIKEGALSITDRGALPPTAELDSVEQDKERNIRGLAPPVAHTTAVPTEMDVNPTTQAAPTAVKTTRLQCSARIQADPPQFHIFDLPIAEENVAPRERLLMASMHAPVEPSGFAPSFMQSSESLHYQAHELPTTIQPWPVLRVDSKPDQRLAIVPDPARRHLSTSIHAPRMPAETAQTSRPAEPRRLESVRHYPFQISSPATRGESKLTRNEIESRFASVMEDNVFASAVNRDLGAPNWAEVGARVFHAVRRGPNYEAARSTLAPADRIIRKPPKAVVDSKGSATNLLDNTSVIAPSASIVGLFGENSLQSYTIQRDRSMMATPTNHGNLGSRSGAWTWFGSPTRNERTIERHVQEIFSPVRQLFPTSLPKYGGTLYKARSTASLVNGDFSSNSFMATSPVKQTYDGCVALTEDVHLTLTNVLSSIPHTTAGRWKARLAGGPFDMM